MQNLEPKVNHINFNSQGYNESFIRGINWYTMEKDVKDARSYLRQYIKANYPQKLKDFDNVVDSKIINTYGWIARLTLMGATLSPNHIERLEIFIKSLLVEKIVIKKPKEVQAQQKKSVYDYTQEKASEYIGELEGILDEDTTDFNLLNDLKAKNVPQPYVTHIHTWAKSKLGEFIKVYESKELQDGYGWSKNKAKNLAKFIAAMIEDLNKYSSFRKANRKPKPKKEKLPAAQIKNLKYKIKDEELNIQSVSPLEIVGASQVWLYNTKTKKLSVYKTESSAGIQVKGTTLQNYEPELSCTKTLRKPVETLAALSKAGKVQLRKFIDELSTKPQEVNGRVNTDMLIIRTVK